MKLRDDYLMTSVGEGYVLVPVGKAAESLHGVVRLNATAGFIVQQLRQEQSESALVDALLKDYDVDRETASKHVAELLAKLCEIGAVE